MPGEREHATATVTGDITVTVTDITVTIAPLKRLRG